MNISPEYGNIQCGRCGDWMPAEEIASIKKPEDLDACGVADLIALCRECVDK